MASFKSSFAAARKAGKKAFTWNGKSYNTKLAKGNGTPATAPTPTAAPRAKAKVSTRATSESREKAKATKGKTRVLPKKAGGFIKKLRMDVVKKK